MRGGLQKAQRGNVADRHCNPTMLSYTAYTTSRAGRVARATTLAEPCLTPTSRFQTSPARTFGGAPAERETATANQRRAERSERSAIGAACEQGRGRSLNGTRAWDRARALFVSDSRPANTAPCRPVPSLVNFRRRGRWPGRDDPRATACLLPPAAYEHAPDCATCECLA